MRISAGTKKKANMASSSAARSTITNMGKSAARRASPPCSGGTSEHHLGGALWSKAALVSSLFIVKFKYFAWHQSSSKWVWMSSKVLVSFTCKLTYFNVFILDFSFTYGYANSMSHMRRCNENQECSLLTAHVVLQLSLHSNCPTRSCLRPFHRCGRPRCTCAVPMVELHGSSCDSIIKVSFSALPKV